MIPIRRGRDYNKNKEIDHQLADQIALENEMIGSKVGRPSKKPSEERLGELYENYTIAQIADLYGVDRKTVSNWLRSYRQNNDLTNKEAAEIISEIRAKYRSGSRKANALDMAICRLKEN